MRDDSISAGDLCSGSVPVGVPTGQNIGMETDKRQTFGLDIVCYIRSSGSYRADAPAQHGLLVSIFLSSAHL